MIAAVIPTRFHPPKLQRLIDVLYDDGVAMYVIEDEGDHAPDWSLYRLWNEGVGRAIRNGAEYIAVLNDDITIESGALPRMAEWLALRPDVGVVYPDVRGGPEVETLTPTVGTWGAGAMTGFCFMFRADLNIPFDEGYQLWYGDDAFEEAVRAKGLLVARVDGLAIGHTAMGSTSRIGDEVHAWIANDRRRWETRFLFTTQARPATVTA
jgi:GT2 family glycosyltransferase